MKFVNNLFIYYGFDMKKCIFYNFVVALLLINSAALLAEPKEYIKSIDLNQSYVGFTIQTEGGLIEGKINLKKGELRYTDTILKSFEFIADINSIQFTKIDTGFTEAQMRDVFCSPGFFNCDTFPEMKIISKRVDRKPNGSYFNVANLLIKNIPTEVKFVVAMNRFEKNDGFMTLFYIDRGKSKLRYIPQNNSIKINDKYFFENLEFQLYIILSNK